MGFGVRKDYANKSKKDGLKEKDKRDHLVVNPRRETRTDCKARICLVVQNGKFRVKDFIEEHNHVLHIAETTYMLVSQRCMSDVHSHEIELADDFGIQQRATFAPMNNHVEGRANLGCTHLDQKNYLCSQRQKSLKYGEAGCLLGHFQDQFSANPSFFHAYQMDLDEKITNIFWADARMLLDYDYFGDVVSLDTAYCTNNAHRPLALFSGFNHHRGVVFFGAALLYDETTASYKWLFETFLKAHNQKKPQTIFTNHDQALTKALHECELEATEKLPILRCPSSPMLKQLAKVYTPTIFDMFQDQFDLKEACCVKQRKESEPLFEYVIYMVDHEGGWKVLFHPQEKSISCSCRRFETFGIVCCHVLKVFDVNDVKKLPDQYIFKRWTKEARIGAIHDVKGKEVEEDLKLSRTHRYKNLCQSFVKLASEVSGSVEEVSLVRSAMDEVTKKIMALRLEKIQVTNERNDPITSNSIDMSQPTNIKKMLELKKRRTTRVKDQSLLEY
ncbi:protein FAR1-RELATED SEQUENCE 5-like [Senna tora]|uniref:Protein FAR1-RELATED SEQUENCE 5-like n=1 Tax=Senna tora TaxID=362788 RepID=A0A834W2R3_9FABA|nr:protein FAR1-RELATED SEQUENCE 5-like [Senna tora]